MCGRRREHAGKEWDPSRCFDRRLGLYAVSASVGLFVAVAADADGVVGCIWG